MTKAEDNEQNKKCCGKCGCHATKELSAEEQRKLDFYNEIILAANKVRQRQNFIKSENNVKIAGKYLADEVT